MTIETAVQWLREHHCAMQTMPGEDGPDDGQFHVTARCYDPLCSTGELTLTGPDLVEIVERFEREHFAQHVGREDLGSTILERRAARQTERSE